MLDIIHKKQLTLFFPEDPEEVFTYSAVSLSPSKGSSLSSSRLNLRLLLDELDTPSSKSN